MIWMSKKTQWSVKRLFIVASDAFIFWNKKVVCGCEKRFLFKHNNVVGRETLDMNGFNTVNLGLPCLFDPELKYLSFYNRPILWCNVELRVYCHALMYSNIKKIVAYLCSATGWVIWRCVDYSNNCQSAHSRYKDVNHRCSKHQAGNYLRGM